MVDCWFGARWLGILRVPLSNNPFHKEVPRFQTTDPNQQFNGTQIICVSEVTGHPLLII